jgi:peptide/nickel transport system substrate-binding protein
MTLLKRRTSVAAGGLALVLALAACGGGGGSDEGSSKSGDTQKASGQKGGVVKVLNQEDFEHLDPQRNYVTNSGNAGRLITRTLTIVKEETDKAPEIVGDLAKSWESSDSNKTWTFKLKDNLKYEDGTPVTAADVKYGVERSFSPDLAEGSPYARNYMADSSGYKGPYVGGNNGGKGLESIQAPDDKTITFKLNQPVADFMWTVSMFTFSPVPKAKDTKTLYDNHPISTGPYKIKDYVRGQSLTLVRNDQWDQSTDETRTALPDSFEFAFGQDASVVDQRLLVNGAADQNAMTQDVKIQNQSLGRVNDPQVKDRVVKGPSICVRYVALNMSKPKLKDVKVRQAIEYAVNKKDFQTAYGGPLSSTIVNSAITKETAGYKPVELYKAPDTGDPAKAKQLLQEAGVSNLALTLATADTANASAAAVGVQNSLKQAGINVTVNTLPGDNYYTTIQNDAQAPELMLAGWCADWPSASTVIPPIFGPDNPITPTTHNTNNFSRYDNKASWDEMTRIATQVTDPAEAATAWGALNEKIMEDAPIVPTINDGGIYFVGSKLTDLAITPTFGGEIDLLKVGVKK